MPRRSFKRTKWETVVYVQAIVFSGIYDD
jgi:hypothetical protein